MPITRGESQDDVRSAKFWAFTVQNTPKFSALRGSSQMPITRGKARRGKVWISADVPEDHKFYFKRIRSSKSTVRLN